MYVYDPVTWEQFEQKFREAFGREMTPDEHGWFHAIWTIANSGNLETSKGVAA